MDSGTPELDSWRDLHARVSIAEQAVIAAALAHRSTGATAPSAYEIQNVRIGRSMVCIQFDRAIEEALSSRAIPRHDH